ncbi:MAG: hypothetical protein R3Y24_13505 [Eubacteriales bacterium]
MCTEKSTILPSVDKKQLVDINTVTIDTSLAIPERIVSYLEQVKNPHCFKVGKTVVNIKFSDSNTTMEECLNGYFASL